MKLSIRDYSDNKVLIAMKKSARFVGIAVGCFVSLYFGAWFLSFVPGIGPLLAFIYIVWFIGTLLYIFFTSFDIA